MNWNEKKVIITGGAGFIGSNLVKQLVNHGAQVYVIDNLWRGNTNNFYIGKYPVINIETNFYKEDLTDYHKCIEIIRDFDFVFHLADVVAGIDFTFQHEQFIFRQNLLINSNVLSACIANQIKNYIYIGTACSYPKHLQMSEGVSVLVENQAYPADPESSYGWSKLMGEYEAQLAQSAKNINIGILRFHNVYGPAVSFEKDRSQVLPSLIRKAILYPDEPFIVWGSGEQYRDFIYIDDVITALLNVAEFGMNKGVIQIGSEIPVTIKEAADLIIKISRKSIKPIFDNSKPEGDKGRVANCTRAREILNWSPKVSFPQGLEKTYRWIESEIMK